jgi:DNA polymerase bacteriophage-type
MDIFLDFETYFHPGIGYSLRKMSTFEYVRDERFAILGCAIAIDNQPAKWYEPADFEIWAYRHAREIEPFDTIICHNTYFDGLILTERFGIKPAKWGDTLSMARALLPIQKHNLGDVGEALGFGGKVRDYLTPNTHTADPRLIEGALRDVELCRKVYNRLLPFMPQSELDLIDLTIRCGVESHIQLNAPLLEESLEELKQEREQAIINSGYSEPELVSNQKFAGLLTQLDVVIPTKISATTGEETDAFSKNDPEFQALMADYPEFRHLWEGRLAAKSNIQIRRTEKLLRIANLKPAMGMPLNYWGAKNTGRWSGADGLNVQNLPKKGHIREAFHAPKGWKIIAPDSNKIELRINLWFSEQFDMLAAAAHGDIYRREAAGQFHITEDAVDYNQRQFGKVIQLGLGYGMGWTKFRNTCASGPMGMDPILLSPEEAQRTVNDYRSRHYKVKNSWYFLHDRLPEMMRANCNITHRCVTFVKNGIVLPGGMTLQYPGLHPMDDNDWVYGLYPDDSKNTHIYGGKVQENIIQALGRKIIADQMLEIAKDLLVVSMTHDEIICLVPENEAEDALTHSIEIMSRSPDWAPDLPLGAEGKITDHYGKS